MESSGHRQLRATEQCPGGLSLVDDQSGKSVLIRRPPCSLDADETLDTPWIIASCLGGQTVLYDIRSLAWHRFACDACDGGDGSDWLGSGSQWLLFAPRCGAEHQLCSPPDYQFLSIPSGTVRDWQYTTNDTVPDLDSPSLVRKLCAPLRLPATLVGDAWTSYA